MEHGAGSMEHGAWSMETETEHGHGARSRDDGREVCKGEQ